MNLRSLKYFLVAAEEMNFTRAAQRLFISQQALSSYIRRLEEEYNVTLFERRPALRLTEEGRQMFFYGKRILENEHNLRVSLADISENCRNNLSIGISRLRSDQFFTSIYNHYHATHPNISITLIDGGTKTLHSRLLDGKIDLYIGIDPPDTPNLQRIELARENMRCCMTDSFLQRQRPDAWQELLAHFQDNHGIYLSEVIDFPLITLRPGNRLRDNLSNYIYTTFSPNIVFEGDQQNLIYELSKEGVGVGILSPIALFTHTREIEQMGNSFHIFPLLDSIPESIMYLVYLKDRPVPRYMMEFVQISCMVFRNYLRTVQNFLL